MELKTLRSQQIFQGRVFNLRQDQVQSPNGKSITLDIVEHGGAVTMIPVDEQDRIWFVRQYRHAAAKMLLELPAGTMEAGEEPEFSAHREIREEIGMAAKEMKEIGGFFLAPGYSTEFLHIYLARGLYAAPLAPDEDELIEIERVSIDQAYELAQKGQINDAKSLAALLLARPYLLP